MTRNFPHSTDTSHFPPHRDSLHCHTLWYQNAAVKITALLVFFACIPLLAAAPDETAAAVEKKEDSPATKTATLQPEAIAGFDRQPAAVQDMLRYALGLTARNLAYKAGSSEPDTGGTDCSGFVYHVLHKHGHTAVPRQSNEMYEWVWKAGTFRACNSLASMETFEFAELRPGDLLFWVNSTKDGKTDRDPPVTHVMIYLGKKAADGHPVVAGASDGRTYDGQRMNGVSVFDFRLPAPGSSARFIGYAHLPGAVQEKSGVKQPKSKKP